MAQASASLFIALGGQWGFWAITGGWFVAKLGISATFLASFQVLAQWADETTA